MEQIKVTFITTVFNEEKTIDSFLYSLKNQTVKPDEIIITDGGSTDNTLNKLKMWANSDTKLKIFTGKKVNIAEGRNIAIKHSTNDIIAVSDAGCIIEEDWLENILKPFHDKNIDVVSGWYTYEKNSTFNNAIAKIIEIPLWLINKQKFLPSSRSIAVKKICWEKVNGYPENLKYAAEDTLFAKRLKSAGCNFYFQPTAIVRWLLPNSHKELYSKFFNYAYGDAEIRHNVRYYLTISFIFLIVLVFIPFIFESWIITILFILLIIMYTYSPIILKGISLKHVSFTELMYIFSCKITIILASIFGFNKGLIKKHEI
ncbi:MAG: glycosyltransferase [Patescibacteria group bacterium]